MDAGTSGYGLRLIARYELQVEAVTEQDAVFRESDRVTRTTEVGRDFAFTYYVVDTIFQHGTSSSHDRAAEICLYVRPDIGKQGGIGFVHQES